MTNRIREIREAKSLRQMDVAMRFNPPIDPTRVSMWELGKAVPRGDNLVQLAQILECRVEDIFLPSSLGERATKVG